ncbi:2994_t:CDS:2, partial [Scutellospora calospora]
NEFNIINNGLGKHKGTSCRYYSCIWVQRKAQEMKSHLVMKCRGRIVYSGISFSAFNNPFFEDYIKLLNPSYDLPKCIILASSILDAEAANIIIKVENELSKAKNLTLC